VTTPGKWSIRVGLKKHASLSARVLIDRKSKIKN
jgi:hypothetical protein